MTGCIYKQTDGSWWFIVAWAQGRFAFPFEHGPGGSDAPALPGTLHHGEPATLAGLKVTGTVLVERDGVWCYAGRIDPDARSQ